MPINWAIAGNWQNWARVLLMVIIAGIALDCIGRAFTRKETN